LDDAVHAVRRHPSGYHRGRALAANGLTGSFKP
jgi:hypothetical protein